MPPDIVMLNEIKLDSIVSNDYLDFPGYNSISKPRNRYGGGVAILVRQSLNYSEDHSLDLLNLELVSINLKLVGKEVKLVSLYNPPNKELSVELFKELSKVGSFILGGDLNSKNTDFGCKENNKNGAILGELLNEFGYSLLNNRQPTFFQVNRNYSEILDLFITTPDIASKTDRFAVDIEFDFSDHYPVRVILNLCPHMMCPENKEKLNFRLANWALYKQDLESRHINLETDNIEELNSLICDSIVLASKRAIPRLSEKVYKTALPKDIVKTIKDRRKARRKFKHLNTPENRAEYYKLTAVPRKRIIEHRNKSWATFNQKFGKNPLSSRPFWQRINRFRNNKNTLNRKIPTLYHEGLTYETSKYKAEVFSEILAKTFSPNNTDNDDTFEIESAVYEFEKMNTPISVNLTLEEIKDVINKSKKDSSMGLDNIHYLMLKNLPNCSLEMVRALFNKCIIQSKIPETWKEAKITMIPKKGEDKSNPNSYRPISVTSCLGKILEKVMANRLYSYLESNKLLTNIQSGFRKHRRTSDNLFFLTQKVAESFNRKKNVCCLFFDISKAFDKVWHKGLIYKLIKLNIPHYLIKFTISFLHGRSFKVCVDESLSDRRNQGWHSTRCCHTPFALWHIYKRYYSTCCFKRKSISSFR